MIKELLEVGVEPSGSTPLFQIPLQLWVPLLSRDSCSEMKLWSHGALCDMHGCYVALFLGSGRQPISTGLHGPALIALGAEGGAESKIVSNAQTHPPLSRIRQLTMTSGGFPIRWRLVRCLVHQDPGVRQMLRDLSHFLSKAPLDERGFCFTNT